MTTDTSQPPIQQISDLRERIQIIKSQQTPDGNGGYTETLTVQKTIWALIRMTDSPPQTSPTRQENLAHYEVVCRFTELTPGQKIRFRNKEATIKSISELDNKKGFMSLLATVIIN